MRTITTVEELDALPPEAVVSNESGALFLKLGSRAIPGYPWVNADAESADSSEIELPATLLSPLQFDAEDVEKVARAIFEGVHAARPGDDSWLKPRRGSGNPLGWQDRWRRLAQHALSHIGEVLE